MGGETQYANKNDRNKEYGMNRFLMIFGGVLALFGATALHAGGHDILGAGATFPYPLYSKMFDDYYQETGDRINYQAIGSGGGVRQIQNRTVDFGATDAFVSNKDLTKFKSDIIHIPTCLGAVVLTYNLPGRPQLTLSGEIIAGIFLGKIKRWDDARIKALNPAVKLPNLMIAVIHRSDGSGTSHVLTDYLAKISPEWKSHVGVGKSVNWPVGLGGKGNPGTSGLIKQIPGAIGYVELVYTTQNKMPVARLKNRRGNVITPSVGAVSEAVPRKIPDDLRILITDTNAEQGYPISSFTWLLVYKEQAYSGRNIDEARALQKMLRWTVKNASRYAAELGYAPVPRDTAVRSLELIETMTFKGKSLSL